MLLEATYVCASCGEVIDTMIDPSAGYHQIYTEDCTICCRPNTLRIECDGVSAYVTASFEE